MRQGAPGVNCSPAICYGETAIDIPVPFIISLDKRDPVHVLDSHNLEIVLAELDTLPDLNDFLDAKEGAIRDLDFLTYCGEEDLLAHYFYNYEPATKALISGSPTRA
jgi:hypothetical protein